MPATVLTAALFARFRSREEHTFGDKLLSAMRFGFGGHVEGAEPIDPEPARRVGAWQTDRPIRKASPQLRSSRAAPRAAAADPAPS